MKWIGALVLVVGIVGLAWLSVAQPALTIAVPALPASLDPHGPAFWAPNSPLPNVYETLLAHDARGRLVPALAVSWRSLEGGRVLEFSLRPGVRFHDGAVMDTAVVRASLGRFLDAARGQPWGGPWRAIAGVDVAGAGAIRVRGADAALPLELFVTGGAIVSPRQLSTGGRQPASFAGTGPYRIEDVKPGHSLTLAAFPEYWGRRPDVPAVTFAVVPAPADRIAAVRSGQAHIATDVSRLDLDRGDAASLARGAEGGQPRLYAVAPSIGWAPRKDQRLLVAEFGGRRAMAAPSPPRAAAPPPRESARVEPPVATAPPVVAAPPARSPVPEGGPRAGGSATGSAPTETRSAPRAPNGHPQPSPAPGAPPTLGTEAPPPPRVYNARFEEGGEANARPNRLDPNRDYHLLFYIGEPAPENILKQEPLNAYLRHRAAAGHVTNLDLVVMCPFCTGSQAIQRRTVRLGASGNTEVQRYVLTPTRSGDFELVLAVEFNQMTVQSFTVPVRVGTSATASAAPTLSAGARPLPPPMLNNVEKVKAADLTLTFVRSGDGRYRVDVVSGDGAIDLRDGTSLFDDDLKLVVKDLWQRLRLLVKNHTVSFSQKEIDTATFNPTTRDAVLLELARIGRGLYEDLFRPDTAVLAKLKEFRARPATSDPPLVYIKTLGVFLPWAIVYDGDPEELERGHADPTGFWGYRYRLEGWLLDGTGAMAPDALQDYPVTLLFGFYSGGDQTFKDRLKDQETFFGGYANGVRLVSVGTNDDLKAKLKAMRKEIEILYLYAHGNGGQKSVWGDSAGTPVEVWIPEPNRAAIALSPMPPPGGLEPQDFMHIFVNNEPLHLDNKPIVFLNVCEGEGNAAISQMNFVSSFMTLGARAVIASDAEVWQNVAQTYAKDLFRRMFDPGSTNDLSRVMFDLRRLYLSRDNNALPFLYTLWGHGAYKASRP